MASSSIPEVKLIVDDTTEPLHRTRDAKKAREEYCYGVSGGASDRSKNHQLFCGLSGSSSGVSTVSGDGIISTTFGYDSSLDAMGCVSVLDTSNRRTQSLDYSDASSRLGYSDNGLARPYRGAAIGFMKGTAYSNLKLREISTLKTTGSVDETIQRVPFSGLQRSSTLTVPGDDCRALPTRKPNGHQKVTRSAPLLAPPPRFPPEDDEDEHSWIDLADTTCYFECPELLESYRALRPRLSYRSVQIIIIPIF